jgi:hypothetical protein
MSKLTLILKIIISFILMLVLIIFPIIASRYVNLSIDKEILISIEKPVKKVSKDYMNMLNLAEQDFKANEENADSAPKQTVVALWSIKDIQSILVIENKEIIDQNYDLSSKLARNAEILNNNLIIKSEQISILLFYLMISILLIGDIGILLFIWRKELKL